MFANGSLPYTSGTGFTPNVSGDPCASCQRVDWNTGLTSSTNYVVKVIYTLPSPLTCNLEFQDHCQGYYWPSIVSSCGASVGTEIILGDGTSVGTYEYDLCDGGTINFDATGETIPSGGNYLWYIFSSQPSLPLSAGQLADATTIPGYLGQVPNITTSVSNTGGVSSAPSGYNTLWALQVVSDSTTSTIIDDGNDCADIATNTIKINFITDSCTSSPTSNDCGDCTTPLCAVDQVSSFAGRTYLVCNIYGIPATGIFTTYHTLNRWWFWMYRRCS